MTKIFIDSNVLISAIVFDKKELDVIIMSLENEDDVFISEHIIEESTRVFIKKFPEYLELYEKFITLSELKIVPKNVYLSDISMFEDIRDKYDAHVIACANRMKCDFIITGDKDLLTYRKTKIKIMRAPEYLDNK